MLVAARDLRHESIAPAGYRRDIAILVVRLAQHVPQRGDVLREAVFLDDHVAPYRLQQRVLVEQFSRVLHKIGQRVEDLGCERDSLARVTTQQVPLADVQGEITKLVARANVGHGRLELRIRTNHNFSSIGQGFLHGIRSMS